MLLFYDDLQCTLYYDRAVDRMAYSWDHKNFASLNAK